MKSDYPIVVKNRRVLNKILKQIPKEHAEKIRYQILDWICLQSGMILGLQHELKNKEK